MAWSPPADERRHSGFNHPETTPPTIPTKRRTAPGFVDYEALDETRKLYFNGNLFRRGNAEKVVRVLATLNDSERRTVSEVEEILKKRGCMTQGEIEKILGKSLLNKLNAISMYDISTVRNEKEEVGYVTRPAAFNKYGDGMADDALDLAKALVSSLTYGMTRRPRTPQAIERIFWTKGLQLALGIEQSIVATTDKRMEVSEFGREHGVIVLDGDFVNRLGASVRGVLKHRLTEEGFSKMLTSVSEIWNSRIAQSRSLVLRGLDYDSINFWLEEARYFTEQFLQQPSRLSDVPLRVTYVLVSLIAIAFDFLSRELAFVASQGKYSTIVDGLRYGQAGRAATIKMVEIAAGLAERYLDAGRVAGTRLRSGFEREIADLRVNILGEYFGRSSASQTLFGVARELEQAAYAKEFVKPWNLSVEGQALIGVLADYWDLDRSKLLNAPPSSSAPAPTLAG